MGFLLDHLPPQLQLIISTRADPALPWRGCGPAASSWSCARPTCGSPRTRPPPTSTTSTTSTSPRPTSRPWRPGPRAGSPPCSWPRCPCATVEDTSGFIAGFAGDDRFVVDYLADEVLDRQPPDVRRFLLDTCILERLTGPLCDAVTGGSGGVPCSSPSSGGTCSSSRWTTSDAGTATTTCSVTSSSRACSTSEPADVPRLHRRASDWSRQAATWSQPSGTPSQPRTWTGPPT